MNRHVEVCETAITLRAGPLGTLDNTTSEGGVAKAKPSESLKDVRHVRKTLRNPLNSFGWVSAKHSYALGTHQLI